MIKLTEGKLDLDTCRANLEEFKALLDANDELEETGSGSLQEFFGTRLNLLLLMGDVFGPAMWPTHYQVELVLIERVPRRLRSL